MTAPASIQQMSILVKLEKRLDPPLPLSGGALPQKYRKGWRFNSAVTGKKRTPAISSGPCSLSPR